MTTPHPTGSAVGGRPPAAPVRSLAVAVHNGHCHKYGVCQQEAPEVFALRSDDRLRYDSAPRPELAEQVRSAARLCPMQAITVDQA
jgi:ferredoxin